jgi:hypothetical protein
VVAALCMTREIALRTADSCDVCEGYGNTNGRS